MGQQYIRNSFASRTSSSPVWRGKMVGRCSRIVLFCVLSFAAMQDRAAGQCRVEEEHREFSPATLGEGFVDIANGLLGLAVPDYALVVAGGSVRHALVWGFQVQLQPGGCRHALVGSVALNLPADNRPITGRFGYRLRLLSSGEKVSDLGLHLALGAGAFMEADAVGPRAELWLALGKIGSLLGFVSMAYERDVPGATNRAMFSLGMEAPLSLF